MGLDWIIQKLVYPPDDLKEQQQGVEIEINYFLKFLPSTFLWFLLPPI